MPLVGLRSLGGSAQASAFVYPQPCSQKSSTCCFPLGRPPGPWGTGPGPGAGCRAGLCPASLLPSCVPSRPWGGPAVGTWGLAAGCWGCRGRRVVFSLPATTRAGPAAPWPRWLPSHLLLPVDTRPPPPGQKVSTWEPGCAGASKTARQQVPSETPESTSGVGAGGFRPSSWEAEGKGRACVPGLVRGVIPRGLRAPLAHYGSPEYPAQNPQHSPPVAPGTGV